MNEPFDKNSSRRGSFKSQLRFIDLGPDWWRGRRGQRWR
jgi:hypothetical protein